MGVRKEQSSIPLTMLALVMAVALAISSGLSAPLAYALPKDDPDEPDVAMQDFDIRSFGIAGGNPYLQVYGHAGRTLATEEEQIFAYVFYTDNGIWAANNHGFGHGDPEGDAGNVWHSEEIFLNDDGCLTAANNESENRIAGKRVTLIGTGATVIDSVATVELVHVADDPEVAGCPAGSIAKVVDLIDASE